MAGDETRLECRFELTRADKGYRVRFHIGDTLVAEGDFDFDFSPTSHERAFLSDIDRGEGCITLDDLQELGTRLWNALRPPEIRKPFEALAKQARVNRPLRVWLDIPPGGEGELLPLERLPWEALHDEGIKNFLAVHLCYCLLRAPPADCPTALLPAPREGPLRMLVLIPEGSGLDVQREWQHIQDIAHPLKGALEVERISGLVTPDRIQERLEAGPWDLLHYIGHGEVIEGRGITIRLNHQDPSLGKDNWMDAPSFASLLQGQQLRFVLLNCCLGASFTGARTLFGLGPHLMSTAGIPAVVAMRYEISDPPAIKFTEKLYRELFMGHSPGRVDLAIQRARRDLMVNATPDTLRSFITPVLHLSPGCEQLFVVPELAAPSLLRPARALPSLELPDELVTSLQKGLCLPVVGPVMHPESAMRRAAPDGKGPPAPALSQLILDLAHERNYPEAHELPRMMEHEGHSEDWLLPLLLARVCEHYQQGNRRYLLVQWLEKACKGTEPPVALQQIATWNVPGIFYLHFDGMMEEALKRAQRTPQVINHLDHPQAGVLARPVLVNVVGTLSDEKSLKLSEGDLESLWWEAVPHASAEVQKLTQISGQSLLFLGVSPRDLLVRRLNPLLQGNLGNLRGPCYFVTRDASPVDEAYWKSFGVNWIREEPSAVIEELTRRAELGGRRP